jgi:hypothetical protein
VSQLKSSFAFSLQLDESTDVSGLAVVLVFLSYLFQKKAERDLLSKRAVLKILPFPTTYLCEAGISRYAAIRSKYSYRLDVATYMRIQFSTITPSLKEFVRRINIILHTSNHEVRLNVYTNSERLLYSYFCVSLGKIDCKHNRRIISSDISIFNFGHLLSGHYIYVSKDVTTRGYFPKPKETSEQKSLGTTVLGSSHSGCYLRYDGDQITIRLAYDRTQAYVKRDFAHLRRRDKDTFTAGRYDIITSQHDVTI